jgi:hypothetical protein
MALSAGGAAMEVWEVAPAGTRLFKIPGVALEQDRQLFAANGKELHCYNVYWATDGHFSIREVSGLRQGEEAPISIDRAGASWRLLPGTVEEISSPRMSGTSYVDGTYSSYAAIERARATVKKCPVALELKLDWVQGLLRQNVHQIDVSYKETAYRKGQYENEPWYEGTVTIDLQTLSLRAHVCSRLN